MATIAEVKEQFAIGQLESLQKTIRQLDLGFKNGKARVVCVIAYIKCGNRVIWQADPLLADSDGEVGIGVPLVRVQLKAPGRDRIDLQNVPMDFDLRALPTRLPGERGILEFSATLSLESNRVLFLADPESKCFALALEHSVDIAKQGAIHRLIAEAQAKRERERKVLIAEQRRQIETAKDPASKKQARQPRQEILALLPFQSFGQWFRESSPTTVISRKS